MYAHTKISFGVISKKTVFCVMPPLPGIVFWHFTEFLHSANMTGIKSKQLVH